MSAARSGSSLNASINLPELDVPPNLSCILFSISCCASSSGTPLLKLIRSDG